MSWGLPSLGWWAPWEGTAVLYATGPCVSPVLGEASGVVMWTALRSIPALEGCRIGVGSCGSSLWAGVKRAFSPSAVSSVVAVSVEGPSVLVITCSSGAEIPIEAVGVLTGVSGMLHVVVLVVELSGVLMVLMVLVVLLIGLPAGRSPSCTPSVGLVGGWPPPGRNLVTTVEEACCSLNALGLCPLPGGSVVLSQGTGTGTYHEVCTVGGWVVVVVEASWLGSFPGKPERLAAPDLDATPLADMAVHPVQSGLGSAPPRSSAMGI